MPGFSYNFKKPLYVHDCKDCEFLFTVLIHLNGGVEKQKADVYKSCDKSNQEYLVRYSSEVSNYATVNLECIMGYYVVGHFDDIRRNFYKEI